MPTLQPWTDNITQAALTHSHPRAYGSTPSLHDEVELHRPWPRSRPGEHANCWDALQPKCGSI